MSILRFVIGVSISLAAACSLTPSAYFAACERDADCDGLTCDPARGRCVLPEQVLELDAGAGDTHIADAGAADANTADASTADANAPDASTADASTADANTADANTADASTADASTPDASTPDVNAADANTADAASPDLFAPTGTDYYVSSHHPSRSDSNDGTSPDAPWEAFALVMSVWDSLSPGDTIHLERGSSWDLSLDSWTIDSGGAPSSHITLRGDDYGEGAMPVLRRSDSSGDGTFIQVNTSYVTIQGLELDGNMAAGGASTGIVIGGWGGADQEISHVHIIGNHIHDLGGGGEYTCGIRITDNNDHGVHHCLFEGNTVSDYSAHGLLSASGNVSFNTWRGNTVINDYPQRYGSSNSALRAGSPGEGNVYERNYLRDTTTTEACFISGSSEQDTVNVHTVRHNVIAECGSVGMLFVKSSNDTPRLLWDVYGNIIHSSTGSGLAIHPYDFFGAGTRFRVYNNTFYGNYTAGGIDAFRAEVEFRYCAGVELLDFRNNLIYHPDTGDTSCLSVSADCAGGFSSANNLYFRTGNISAIAISFDDVDMTLAQVLELEPSAQNSDPLFLDVGALPAAISAGAPAPRGLAVDPGSPAVDNGALLSDEPGYAWDIEGTPRTNAWDIGAYEQ